MRLLTAAFPQLTRLLPSGRWLVTGTFVGMLVALECVGRVAQSDLHDVLAALVLLAGVLMLLVRHKREPLGWVAWAGRRARGLIRVEYQCGYDFRGDPPYPARLPPEVWGLAAALVAAAAGAGAAAALLPEGVRAVGVHVSYVAYLAGLTLVWVGLAAGLAAGFTLPDFVYTWFFGRRPGRGPWLARLAALAAYLSVAWSCSQMLPPVLPLAAAGAGLGVAVARLARRHPDDAAFLWRAGPDRPIAAVPLRLIIATVLGLAGLAVVALVVTACGPALLALPAKSPLAALPPPAELPVMVLTPALGASVAWLMPGAVAAVTLWLAIARRLDPAARTPPTASIRGDRPAADLVAVARAVSGWGWRVRRPGGRPADVAVEVVPPDQSEAAAYDAGWPLKVCPADLADPAVKDRLLRRDELTLRKAALKGVRTLLERGRAERRAKGGSFQFAPHWWFSDRMSRDEPRRGGRSGKPRPVGPPFQRLFAPRVRQHLHAVLRATQIDVILVEDGVSPRRVEKVFKAVFELYDKHRGTRRAEEHAFRGVPDVRVMLHDYTPESPFKATRYAEPHLDGELDRARVLHVFRDHGGDEAESPDPFDFSWEPAPALGVS